MTNMTDEEYAQYQQYRKQVAQHQSIKQQHHAISQNNSAVIDGKWLDGQQSVFERYIGILLLIASFTGSAIAMNGGIKAVFFPGIVGGFALQGIITWVEWIYRRDRLNWKYGVAFIVDTLLTVLGFGPLLISYLIALLTKTNIDHILPEVLTIDRLAWLLIAILAAILALLPEAILIKD